MLDTQVDCWFTLQVWHIAMPVTWSVHLIIHLFNPNPLHVNSKYCGCPCLVSSMSANDPTKKLGYISSILSLLDCFPFANDQEAIGALLAIATLSLFGSFVFYITAIVAIRILIIEGLSTAVASSVGLGFAGLSSFAATNRLSREIKICP
jgi:hypothetical protein